MKRVLQTIILALILPVSCGIQERNMTTAYYGPWQKVQFEGTVTDSVKTKYLLTVKYRAHSGDGTFTLQLSEADSPRGKNRAVTYTGRRYTQRGIPSDNDATLKYTVQDFCVQRRTFLPIDSCAQDILDCRSILRRWGSALRTRSTLCRCP